MHVGHTATAVVTGKPVEMGGSLGRREATGRGVMIVAARVGQAPRLRHQGRDASPSRASATSARSPPSCSPSIGAKIVAVTDWKGGVYNPNGLDIAGAARATSAEHKTVAGFPGAEPLTNDELFGLDVDVLIPAALENQITAGERRATSRRRSSSKAPTARPRPTRTSHLHERGVFVVPDILANAGGVTASYFEWVQDRYGYFWAEKEVNERLEAKMCEAFDAVLADRAAVQGRHAHRRLHRGDQPRRDGHADARDVRVTVATR